MAGHKGIPGDEVARKSSTTKFTGPEPGMAIAKTAIPGAVAEWITDAQQGYWNNVERQLTYV